MARSSQSNPVYYSLASLSSGQNPSIRTVILHKRPDHSGFGVYIGEDVPSGLYIVTVERNSPASDANIQPGDRVLAVNGQAVSSMPRNPKETLIQAASNAQSLALTIQSTDIFQALNIPLTNSRKDNHTQHKQNHQPLGRTLNNNTDLESYIKSLFGNEDIQLLPASNKNEFILKSDSYPKSSTYFSSVPNRSHHSGERKKQHRSHHHRHRQPKPTLLQTRETQTSINDDLVENIPQEQQSTSPLRQPTAHPSMGKSQLILRAQQQTAPDNTARESQQSEFSANNNELDFMPLPPSPISDHVSPSSTMNQTALPAQTAAVSAPAVSSPIPNKVNRNSTKNDGTITHMVDAVAAAMAAARKKDQSDGREQVVSREPASSIKQTSFPPPPNRPTENSSRESAPIPKRTTTPPPSRSTENSSRESAPIPKRTTTPPQNPNVPPPPYTPAENKYESSKPVDNRNSVKENASNLRNSETNRSTTLSNQPDSLRDVHLHRVEDFQGFGFHLQYNKSYYLVQRTEPDSPAENGGLRTNDVILSINQQNTSAMPHVTFVDIVNGSTDVYFLVQTLEDYLRANPQRVRTQPAAGATVASSSNEPDKPKSGISKALGKLTNR